MPQYYSRMTRSTTLSGTIHHSYCMIFVQPKVEWSTYVRAVCMCRLQNSSQCAVVYLYVHICCVPLSSAKRFVVLVMNWPYPLNHSKVCDDNDLPRVSTYCPYGSTRSVSAASTAVLSVCSQHDTYVLDTPSILHRGYGVYWEHLPRGARWTMGGCPLLLTLVILLKLETWGAPLHCCVPGTKTDWLCTVVELSRMDIPLCPEI